MLKNYFVSLQALGDNLISLSLLAQLNERIKIIGTRHTKHIITLMNVENKFDVFVLFEDIPAFYDIRKQGFFKAIKDIIKFRHYIKKYCIEEQLVFEKQDWRVRLLTFGLRVNVKSGFYDNNVYVNRKLLIEDVYKTGINASLDKISFPLKDVRRVLINPTTRVSLKNIQSEHLCSVVEILQQRNLEVTLIDFERSYVGLKNKVTYYRTDTTLNDVKAMLLETDIYIGADSFLIHYAYYLNKPFFIIFNQENTNFLPPICGAFGNYIMSTNGDFNRLLSKKFLTLGII